MSLALRLSSDVPSDAHVVPALAHVDDTRVLFRALDVQGTYPDFRVDVVDPPDAALLTAVDRFLAPDVMLSREYIGSVTEPRLGKPILRDPRALPLSPDCWDGDCDYVSGQMTMPCEEDDAACQRRQRACPNGMCEITPVMRVLPEGAEDVRGFAADYTVLYTPAAIPPGSWAALKLGAPKGLEPGYHLGKVLETSAEASNAADGCIEEARTAAFDRFNTEHGTAYDGVTLSCLTTRTDACLSNVELPDGDAAIEFAALIKAEEVERGCLDLAPDLVIIRDLAQEQIAVLVTTDTPSWFPTVTPAPPLIPGQDEVACSGPIAEALMGWSGRPDPRVTLTSYTGSLCPEESLSLSDTEGVFSVTNISEHSGHQACEIKLTVTVPPGYRFRRPAFIVRGSGARETEDVLPARITMTYAMTPNAASEPPMTSHHVVWGPITSTDPDDFVQPEEYFQLLDTPQLAMAECSADCEPTDVELKIDIDMDTPEGATMRFDGIEGQFDFGAEWTACHRDFSAR